MDDSAGHIMTKNEFRAPGHASETQAEVQYVDLPSIKLSSASPAMLLPMDGPPFCPPGPPLLTMYQTLGAPEAFWTPRVVAGLLLVAVGAFTADQGAKRTTGSIFIPL